MDEIKEYGQTDLNNNRSHKKVHLLSIIGEIEGHENVASGTKATKYEHVLPQLAQVEDDEDTEGLLIILNTVGGDVECGLAIAEMITLPYLLCWEEVIPSAFPLQCLQIIHSLWKPVQW